MLNRALIPIIVLLGLLLGLAREMTIASQFGISRQLDAYAAVFGFYVFFGVQISNTVEAAFIAKYSHLDNTRLINHFISSQLGLLLVVLLAITVLFGVSKSLIALLFEFDGVQAGEARKIIYSFFPAMIFAAMAGLFKGLLNIKGRFVPTLAYGAVVSTMVTLVVFAFGGSLGVQAMPLGYGVGNLAALLLFGCLVVALFKKELVANKTVIRRPFYLWLSASWILVSEVLFQISYTTERSFATGLGEGVVSAYFYAVSVLMVFTALVIQPATTVLFPYISRKFRQDPDEAKKVVLKWVLVFFLLGAIAAAVLYNVAPWFIDLVFVRGKFDSADALMTSGILQVLLWVLPFMSVSRLLKNSLYSKGHFFLPVVANLVRWISLVAIAPVFMSAYSINGLAMAYVVSAASVPLLLLVFFVLFEKQIKDI